MRYIRLLLTIVFSLAGFSGLAADPAPGSGPAPTPKPGTAPGTPANPNPGPAPWPKPEPGPTWHPTPGQLENFRLNLERKRLEIEVLREKNPVGGLGDYRENISRYREGIDTYKRKHHELQIKQMPALRRR